MIGASFEGCFLPSLEKIGSMFLEKRIFFYFVNVFSLFRNYIPLEKRRTLYLTNLNPFLPRMLCAILSMYFWYFVIISPWIMVGPLHLLNLNPLLFFQRCFFQVWLKLALRFWRRGFLNFVNVLLLFRNNLPLKKGRKLHLKKLESPLPNDDWPSLDKIGSVFLDKRIF